MHIGNLAVDPLCERKWTHTWRLYVHYVITSLQHSRIVCIVHGRGHSWGVPVWGSDALIEFL